VEELKDVNIAFKGRLIDIDSSTKVIDFMFDNIFTDINVRNTIEENIGIVENLREDIKYVISKLNNERSAIEYKREQVEEEIRELVIEFGNAEKYSNEN